MENIFQKDKIPTFDYKSLHGKVLEMYVNESEEAIHVNGIDTETGIIYVLFTKIKDIATKEG